MCSPNESVLMKKSQKYVFSKKNWCAAPNPGRFAPANPRATAHEAAEL